MRYSEVHLHFEGSVLDIAISKIERRRNVKGYSPSSNLPREKFFEHINYVSRELLTSKEDYLDAFETLCEFLSLTHEYVEITISPGAFDYYHEGNFEGILTELSQKAMGRKKPKVNFIIEILRNSGVDMCWSYLDFAKKVCDNLPNVVGASLAGNELLYPTKTYVPHITRAKKYGLNVTVHAGEWGTADDIWMALEAGADRIGHGIRSVDDDSLLAELKNKGIFLEVCPSSNLYTGASSDLNELTILGNNGINLTVNTDDPAILNTSLERELDLFGKLAPNYEFKEPHLFDRGIRLSRGT